MRLSLQKGAHSVSSGASVQEIRGPARFLRDVGYHNSERPSWEGVTNNSGTGRVPLNVRTSVHGTKTTGRSPNQSSSSKGQAAINKNLLGFLLQNAFKEGQRETQVLSHCIRHISRNHPTRSARLCSPRLPRGSLRKALQRPSRGSSVRRRSH